MKYNIKPQITKAFFLVSYKEVSFPLYQRGTYFCVFFAFLPGTAPHEIGLQLKLRLAAAGGVYHTVA